ncbi:S8 family serine peptidase [Halomonas sp. M20]|uniref:S8 family serine peptidase n=1 Tax=Halomonas sp. M20 TaxID=2763264 RepID=UPI001D0B6A9C|nr:S8 family serine peptidase [Halomonas sp. M20]
MPINNPPILLSSLLLITFSMVGCAGGGGGSSSSSTAVQPAPAPSPTYRSVPDTDTDTVLVGVADSGFRITHESLVNKVVSAKNLADPDDADVTANSRHGTAVASIVAMQADNTELVLAKVNDRNDDFAYANVMDYSLGYLADAGARVINHSYSGRLEAPSETASYLGVRSLDSLHRIVTANDGLGSVYVAAAANDGKALSASNPIHRYTDIFERMLIVGGAEGQNVHPLSNYPGEDAVWQSRFLTAPWESVVALNDADDSYGVGYGTSMAAPQVSAYAAAILGLWPHLSAKAISRLLLDTASQASPLYQDNTCGDSGNVNCGAFYLGQGQVDGEAALAPQGTLTMPSGDTLRAGGEPVAASVAHLSTAYGDSLASSGALDEVAMFDALGRDYRGDLSSRVLTDADSRAPRLEQMQRMAAISGERRSVLRGEMGSLDFMSRYTATGETTAARLDGQLGDSYWSVYQFAGDEGSPMSAFAEADFMPMLSFQGGSALTRNLESVAGFAQRLAFGERWALTAEHWRGQTENDGSGLDEEYRAERSDVALALDLTNRLTLSAGAGMVEERHGLLGAQGAAALSLGDGNQMNLGRLQLNYRMQDGLSAFALYEQGRGSMSGDGLIRRIDDIRSEEMALGLQWRRDRQQLAMTLRQPLRLVSADATLSVPVGRTLEGRVLREERHVSLAPSGQQRDIEVGYAFLSSEGSRLQFNLLYSLQPGHDRDADAEVATLLNYTRDF